MSVTLVNSRLGFEPDSRACSSDRLVVAFSETLSSRGVPEPWFH